MTIPVRGVWRRGATAATIGVFAACSIGLATPARAAVQTVTKVTLAPGLVLTTIRDPAGPWVIHVLSVDPSRPLALRVAMPGPMGTFARPSEIGRAGGALAAINGDFTVSPGRPVHPVTRNGLLRTTGTQIGPAFGYAGVRGGVVGIAHPKAFGRDVRHRTGFAIAHVNAGAPGPNQIVAFTPYGGQAEAPPPSGCWVRVRPSGRRAWAPDRSALVRPYRVARAGCTGTVRALPGSVVLSSQLTGPGSATLRRLHAGNTVRLRWTSGFAGVIDSIGGAPTLVRDGRSVAPACTTYLCRRQPRTMVGVRADGTILLVVVDGRSQASVGMTLVQAARLMLDLGARSAVNLDGGGGADMWTSARGIVNNPADPSGERPVTSALLVLRTTATGHRPVGARALAGPVAVSTVSPADAEQAQALNETDGGSTGGLLDLLASLGQDPS